MINFKEEMKNGSVLVAAGIGMLLGAAVLAMFATARMRQNVTSNTNSLNNPANGGIQTVGIKIGSTTTQVAPSYAEAVKNPDKPFTDERGVVHPPLGGSPAPTNVDQSKVVHPPIGGSAPTSPVAPAPAPATTTKTKTPPTTIVPPTPAN